MKWIGLSFAVLLLLACGGRSEQMIAGETMGTTYHIKVLVRPLYRLSAVAGRIHRRLDAINRSMSIYEADSEINRFNAHSDTKDAFPASADFHRVISLSERLYTVTDGAWDGTLQPVIDLWGFGPSGRGPAPNRIPDSHEIETRMSAVGFNKISVGGDGHLIKKAPSVSLDLNSIAKGYAVDQVALILEESGITDFLVEIGGEMIARGVTEAGVPWRVGINFPRPGSPPDRVYQAIYLDNTALATSGDYRNFFEVDGDRYAHVFDPRTGFPVENGVVSASVVGPSCAWADGLATALMVLGPEQGVDLVDRLEGVECMIVVATSPTELTDYYSKGFRALE